MIEDRRGRVSYVIGPDGSPLTMADLPAPGTRRWVTAGRPRLSRRFEAAFSASTKPAGATR